jgi:hypothetical protein
VQFFKRRFKPCLIILWDLERLEEKPVAVTVDARTLRPRIDREVLGSIHTSHYPLVLANCYFAHWCSLLGARMSVVQNPFDKAELGVSG